MFPERKSFVFDQTDIYSYLFKLQRSKTDEHNIIQRSKGFCFDENENNQKLKKNEEN